MGWYGRFAPYVSVAERKENAAKELKKLRKKGQVCEPIVIEAHAIVTTFWGKAWCKHLESYSDYENRLPRGRSCVRHGTVIDLKIGSGEITALVSGSSVYKVKITITKAVKNKWIKIVDECAGKIDSLIELLQGKFSKAVMEIITNPKKGLFPDAKEIKLSCSCPDWADMCKHVAAVLYGVGARLDHRPEELFTLRQVDHGELIAKASTAALIQPMAAPNDQIIADNDLSSLFGIDMSDRTQKDLKPAKKTKKRIITSAASVVKKSSMTVKKTKATRQAKKTPIKKIGKT
ncbi:MAG: SWIM zinc finger family protein [Gammaproteobacteria bacterium]